METLSEYVTRIMKERNLRPVDVARKSGGTIGDSHVTNIVKGTTTNLTIDKLKALALGLGVDPIELFKVAIGVQTQESWTPHSLARTMNVLVDNSDLTRLVQVLCKQKPAKIKALLKSFEIDDSAPR